MSITIGTDPEFFVRDLETQEIVMGCGRIGGTKAEPLPIPGMPAGFGIQEDNVMCELTVPASHNASGFVDNVSAVLDGATKYLSERGLELVAGVPEWEFEQAVLDSNSGASMVGCSPDFDAYSQGEQRGAITAAGLGTRRYCGGHIHIGVEPNCPQFVAVMFADLFIGLPLVKMGEMQGYRRGMYGTPGVYRPTPYGFEYRTPSNYWTGSRARAAKVAAMVENLGRFLQEPASGIRKAMMAVNWNRVRQAILEEDQAEAMNILREYREVVS